MKLNVRKLALAGAILVSPIPLMADEATVTEAGLVEGAGSDERIARAGILQMLGQRVVSETCFVTTGVDAEMAASALEGSLAEIDQILNALENGDAALNIIGAEERPRTLAAIAAMREAWAPVHDAALEVIADPSQTASALATYKNGPALMDAADALSKEIAAQYVNPASLVNADAFLIDLAKRQSVLLEVVAAEACMTTTDVDGLDHSDGLATSIQTFQNTADALLNGMPALGVRKPPSAEIAEALAEVNARWAKVSPALQALAEGGAMGPDEASQLHKDLNSTQSMMGHAVRLYKEASLTEL